LTYFLLLCCLVITCDAKMSSNLSNHGSLRLRGWFDGEEVEQVAENADRWMIQGVY